MVVKADVINTQIIEINGVTRDVVLVGINLDGKPATGEFESPFLNAENLIEWRRIVVRAVTGNRLPEDDKSMENIGAYQSTIVGNQIFADYEHSDIGIVIRGIGKTEDNIFYPAAYGLGT